MHVFSNVLACSEEIDEKLFASARCSAILATLIEGISKLSGPRSIQKVVERKSRHSDISAVKLKRTDTTHDLSHWEGVSSRS